MAATEPHRLPHLGFLAVWQRNFRVWRKLMLPSLIGNFGEPLLYLLLLGYGFGRLVGEVEGLAYMAFLASGILCSSAMMGASFEALYSAFTRMSAQRTWDAMLNTPLGVDDIVLGEVTWAATKACINAVAIMVVASLMGLIGGGGLLLALPVLILAGLAFAAMGMVVTALSPSYDFFLYYITLALTPMLLVSGVFFPLTELPEAVVFLARLLPLAHVVELVRPLVTGAVPVAPLLNLAVIAGYGLAAYALATHLLRRRLAG
ncbi:MAG: ABC transporter permease [Pseudomonadota bacterium]